MSKPGYSHYLSRKEEEQGEIVDSKPPNKDYKASEERSHRPKRRRDYDEKDYDRRDHDRRDRRRYDSRRDEHREGFRDDHRDDHRGRREDHRDRRDERREDRRQKYQRYEEKRDRRGNRIEPEGIALNSEQNEYKHDRVRSPEREKQKDFSRKKFDDSTGSRKEDYGRGSHNFYTERDNKIVIKPSRFEPHIPNDHFQPKIEQPPKTLEASKALPSVQSILAPSNTQRSPSPSSSSHSSMSIESAPEKPKEKETKSILLEKSNFNILSYFYDESKRSRKKGLHQVFGEKNELYSADPLYKNYVQEVNSMYSAEITKNKELFSNNIETLKKCNEEISNANLEEITRKITEVSQSKKISDLQTVPLLYVKPSSHSTSLSKLKETLKSNMDRESQLRKKLRKIQMDQETCDMNIRKFDFSISLEKAHIEANKALIQGQEDQ
ncbi:unnamed protein product [Moneuplotes crassus]|uniref:Uncharacterized protein n=1 Tax=Euplotes crassus TaxID=5936 RepID=A0AAD1XBL6_EUPCR|nr:unnamed protein product [Moneuplotes crassus]